MLRAIDILTPLVEQHHHVFHLFRDDPRPIVKANGLVVLLVTGVIGELDGVVLLRLLIEVMGIHPATVQLSKANLVRSQHLGGLAHNLEASLGVVVGRPVGAGSTLVCQAVALVSA